MLAFSTQVCGFKPGRSHQIFKGEKILSPPSFGKEVKPSVPCRRFAACKRSLNVAWKSTFRQNYRTILAHKFHLSLLGSLVGAPGGGSGNVQKSGGVQGCTISLQAAVYPRRMPQALMVKMKNKAKTFVSCCCYVQWKCKENILWRYLRV